MQTHLSRNYFWGCQEWPYRHVEPKVFAEQYLRPSGSGGSLSDYKFFCFDGYVDCVMVCTERETGDPKFLFFDRDWNLLPFNPRSRDFVGDTAGFMPESLGEMFEIAKVLSEGIPFVRVDMYQTDQGIIVGELTLYPHGGFDPNILPDANELWGSLIDIDGIVSRNDRRIK